MGVRRFTELRAWQVCHAYKKAIYRLVQRDSIVGAGRLRSQLEESAAGPPANVAEGFGRYNPADFARFLVMARASLMESQNHLLDAVDRGCISEQLRAEHNAMAEAALAEVTGLLEYLQSPEALRNARHARERRIVSRGERRTLNPEPESNLEPNSEPNPELGTEPEPNPEREHEPSTEQSEF